MNLKNFYTTSLFLAFSFSIWLLSSCSNSSEDTEMILSKLEDGHAKALITIQDTLFYQSESIFTGDIEIYPTSFRLNVTDQYEGNLVVSFITEKWTKDMPIVKQVFAENPIVSSVMIGKIKDKKLRLGIGYLMTGGEITVTDLNKEKCIISLRGTIAKYHEQQDSSKWKEFKGTIIYKKPKLLIQNFVDGKSIL
ncbi:hypothetical protein VB776_21625 [Arcicella sp. DC2W]|uniref:Uncharacterized protein n=1 Tax=Arcicella gelida TaxID=2984195 RepID=A0ABU5SAX9_9BACT|nr:hypothetical protein [Arcicella sp. DC2W]MEA5405555.1 hypothetical protein [Arcicella sp. DC2W]